MDAWFSEQRLAVGRPTPVRWALGRPERLQEAAFLSAEWDNFDRHTLPREGLLLRARDGIRGSEC